MGKALVTFGDTFMYHSRCAAAPMRESNESQQSEMSVLLLHWWVVLLAASVLARSVEGHAAGCDGPCCWRRWCKGNLQNTFSRDCTLFDRSQPIMLRILWNAVTWHYLTCSVYTPTFLLVPILAILAGIFPIALNRVFALAFTIYFCMQQIVRAPLPTPVCALQRTDAPRTRWRALPVALPINQGVGLPACRGMPMRMQRALLAMLLYLVACCASCAPGLSRGTTSAGAVQPRAHVPRLPGHVLPVADAAHLLVLLRQGQLAGAGRDPVCVCLETHAFVIAFAVLLPLPVDA